MTRPFRISGPWMPLSETESEPGVPFSDRGYGTPQEPGNLGKRRLFPIVIALPVLENHRLGLERSEKIRPVLFAWASWHHRRAHGWNYVQEVPSHARFSETPFRNVVLQSLSSARLRAGSSAICDECFSYFFVLRGWRCTLTWLCSIWCTGKHHFAQESPATTLWRTTLADATCITILHFEVYRISNWEVLLS